MSRFAASHIAGIGPTWFERRQIGLRNPLGTRDFIQEQMYSSIFPCEFWDGTTNNANTSVHGGVFCLEFSPEGSILVAAYERRSVLLFDPLTYKEIYTIENAHHDCVNCVKFLDSRTFATCSDDFTVALWDTRNLKNKLRCFKGHTNWVKNIEYSPQDGLLVTSGFDGNILTWEMNKYTEGEMVYNKVFGTNGLMRTCLTPDASKLIMCTTGGYLIVIHNLDLNTLTQDMDGFKPNMYRLMQLSQTVLPIASDFTALFRGYGKRNRVEFITDFPTGDDAEVVSSLQVHPDGHSVISRNVSNGELSEWSCVHNIEERVSSDESDSSDTEDNSYEGYDSVGWSGYSTSISTTPSYIIQHAHTQSDRNRSRNDSRSDNNEERDLSVSPADVWEALVAIQEARVRRERDRVPELLARPVLRRHMTDSGGILVRPVRSGIYEARPFQISHSARLVQASQSSRNESSSASAQPDASANDSDGSSEESSHSQNQSVPRTRRIIPARLRYRSLYRRSLVGQYDRTSITRKPIYRPRFTTLRVRRYNPLPRLNTNYEMNETQRLQNEVNASPQSKVNGNRVSVISTWNVPSTSGTRVPGGSRSQQSRSRNARQLSVQSPRAPPPDPTVSTLYDTFRVIESNLNSIRETVDTFEGRIHSTLQVLRNFNMRFSGNASSENENGNNNASGSNSGNTPQENSAERNEGNARGRNVGRGNAVERARNSRTAGSSSQATASTSASRATASTSASRATASTSASRATASTSASRATPSTSASRATASTSASRATASTSASRATASTSASRATPSTSASRAGPSTSASRAGPSTSASRAGPSTSASRAGPSTSASRAGPSTSASPAVASTSSQPQPKNERTILMGVFRAGSEDGVRGTSMRRHNIAAVTVSTAPARNSDSSDGVDRVRGRDRSNSTSYVTASQPWSLIPVNRKIHQNVRRLTHFIEEPNLGKGFIKELSISPDGRVICSPFGNGIRLLSFSPTVQDLSHCYPRGTAIPLHELSLNMAHTDTVLSTRFSPYHNILVSGCLSGKIVYYQPLL